MNLPGKKVKFPLSGHALTRVGLLAVGFALCLGGCAPIPAGPEEYSAGRARVVLPSTDWEDLGASNEVLPLHPMPAAFPLQTRAVGLRGANKELLAVILVQTNRTNAARGLTLWAGDCAPQKDLWVVDVAAASPIRIDCLRFKRSANQDDWMEKSYPALVRWMDEHRAEVKGPYSHVSYRFATDGGAYVNVNAIVDQRLLSPKPRNNEEFLAAGLPAQKWSLQVAEAARISAGMVDGFFAVPPFPLPVPNK